MTPPFYLDENVAEGLTGALARLGVEAVTTAHVGRKSASDAQQLLYARETGRALITHNNNDFLLMHETLILWSRAWNVPNPMLHAGILVIDQGAVKRGEPGVRLWSGSSSCCSRKRSWETASTAGVTARVCMR